MLLISRDTINQIDGRIVPGYMAAAGTLAKQLPKIELEYPPIEGCHPGSMNVLLFIPLRVIDPDYTTAPIEWEPGHRERFSLTRIGFECPIGGWRYPAWIYDPHDSPHRFNDYLVEVIARTIPGVDYGAYCRLHLTRSKLYGLVII
jgi:hypothetical protein